jgi:hypothetical protein
MHCKAESQPCPRHVGLWIYVEQTILQDEDKPAPESIMQ